MNFSSMRASPTKLISSASQPNLTYFNNSSFLSFVLGMTSSPCVHIWTESWVNRGMFQRFLGLNTYHFRTMSFQTPFVSILFATTVAALFWDWQWKEFHQKLLKTLPKWTCIWTCFEDEKYLTKTFITQYFIFSKIGDIEIR